MKIATFNINNINKRLANLLGWLADGKAGRGVSSGAQIDGRRLPARSDRKRRLQHRFPRAEIMERRCHSCRARRTGPHAYRAARRSSRHAKPLYRGGGERRAHRHALCAKRQSAAGTQIRIQARLDEAAHFARGRAMCARCARRARRRFSMSCRPMPTSIRRSPTRIMRSCSLNRARCSGSSWVKAGLMRSARFIRMRRCTRSGITNATAGRAMPGFASIIYCSIPRPQSG